MFTWLLTSHETSPLQESLLSMTPFALESTLSFRTALLAIC
jgi:hypothetical protein